jgi:hypothetical protein
VAPSARSSGTSPAGGWNSEIVAAALPRALRLEAHGGIDLQGGRRRVREETMMRFAMRFGALLAELRRNRRGADEVGEENRRGRCVGPAGSTDIFALLCSVPDFSRAS